MKTKVIGEYEQERECCRKTGPELSDNTLGGFLLVSRRLIGKTENNLEILTGHPAEIDHPEIRESLEHLACVLRIDRPKPHPIISFFTGERYDREKGIRIIFCNEHPEDNKDFYDFAGQYSDIIRIKRYSNPNCRTPHFMVSDSKRFRMESKHSREDVSNYNISARSNFNYPEMACHFESLFDKCWERIKE